MKLFIILGLILISNVAVASENLVEAASQLLVCETSELKIKVKTEKESCAGELVFETVGTEPMVVTRACSETGDNFAVSVDFGKEQGRKLDQVVGLVDSDKESLLFAGHIGSLLSKNDGVEVYEVLASFYRFPINEFMNGPSYLDVPCTLEIVR